MIDDFEVSLASDLWVLGGIIFKMATGRLPFKSAARRGFAAKNVYADIMSNKLDWPEGMDQDCRNLIEQLLQPVPEMRIGNPETERNFQQLQAHPFFVGIDFNELMDMQQIMIDTEPVEVKEARERLEKMKIEQEQQVAEQEELRKLMEKKKKPIKIGHLLKTSKYGIKQERMFVLFQTGRLLYYTGQQQSDEMELVPGQFASKINKQQFVIKTKTRELKLT